MSVIQYSGVEYAGVRYPAWAEAAGWLLSVLLIGQVPFWAVVCVCRAVGSCQELAAVLRGSGTVRLRDLLEPDSQWGPALACNRLPTVALDAHLGDLEHVEQTGEFIVNTTSIESCYLKQNGPTEFSQ